MLRTAIEILGGQSALARAIGARQQEVWNWANGRQIPAARCSSIEAATGGQVTVQQLRPDVRWHRVPDAAWPHPEGRPLIDVSVNVQEAA